MQGAGVNQGGNGELASEREQVSNRQIIITETGTPAARRSRQCRVDTQSSVNGTARTQNASVRVAQKAGQRIRKEFRKS